MGTDTEMIALPSSPENAGVVTVARASLRAEEVNPCTR
jgi:hypothetical protein